MAAPTDAAGPMKLRVVLRENHRSALNLILTCTRGALFPNEDHVVLTIGGDQANSYASRHLDLASHFVNVENLPYTSGGLLTCACLIKSPEPEFNDLILALGAADGVTSIVSFAESRVVGLLRDEPLASVSSLARHPSNTNVLASLHSTGRVCVWEVKEGKLLMSFETSYSGTEGKLAFLNNNELVLGGASKQDLVVYNLPAEYRFPLSGYLSSRVISTNGNAVVEFLVLDSSTSDKPLVVLRTTSAILISTGSDATFRALIPAACASLALSKDQKYVAAGSAQGGKTIVVRVEDGVQVEELSMVRFNGVITSVAFGPELDAGAGPVSVYVGTDDGVLVKFSRHAAVPQSTTPTVEMEEDEE